LERQGPDLFDTLLRLHGAEELGRNYVFVRLARINIAGHFDYSEVSRILSAIHRRADWIPVWRNAAERHETLGAAAADAGYTASAGDGYLRASLCWHWASLYAEGAEKSAAHRRCVELYVRGAQSFEPPSARVEVDFDGDSLPAYLRMPAHTDRPPVALLIGGADTNKEELHHWGTEFTRRGMAVVAFDGPGQGEHAGRYNRLVMRFDEFHRAVSRVIDWIESRTELDASRIGVFGNSLGGYLALDAASRDPRIKAAVSNGGFCDARSLRSWPLPVALGFASCLGMSDVSDVLRHVEEHLDLRRAPHRWFPALVVHGALDDLSTAEEARDAARLVNGTLAVVDDGFHTCTNRDHLVAPLFADWLSTKVASEGIGGFREVHLGDEQDYSSVLSHREQDVRPSA
jgi:2,6-dihydroxypseudooxynicotine hydrolase